MSVIWKKNQLFFDHPDIFGFSCDSRTIKPGQMFLAIKGNNFDGHDFVKDALANGASCALVERYICQNNIVVPSVIQTLQKIASLRRNLIKFPVIAITGSVGKTSTRMSLAKSLQNSGFSVFQQEKNFNNILGVSLSLAQAPLDTKFAVLEIGTNHFGEIASIAQIVRPNYSILTHVAPVHIGNFHSFKQLLQEKASLFDFTTHKVFFPQNAWYSDYLKLVSKKNNLHFTLFDLQKDFHNHVQTVCKTVLKDLINDDSLYEFASIPHRRDFQTVSFKNNLLNIIDSSYSSNPISLIEELKNLNTFHGKKYAVLGDMLELGYKERRYHELMRCYLQNIQTFLIGNNMLFLHKKLPDSLWFQSIDQLLHFLQNFNWESGTVLIKGSNAMQLNKITDFLCSINS